jgi:hypothetical protein
MRIKNQQVISAAMRGDVCSNCNHTEGGNVSSPADSPLAATASVPTNPKQSKASQQRHAHMNATGCGLPFLLMRQRALCAAGKQAW